jgi:hypothetical protein
VGFCVFSALPHDNFCHAGVAKIVSTPDFVELRQKLSARRAGAGIKKRDAEASRSLRESAGITASPSADEPFPTGSW